MPAHLSWPQPMKSLIREGCNSLGKSSQMSLIGNHWDTGEFRVNSSSVKGGLSFVTSQGECNIVDDS